MLSVDELDQSRGRSKRNSRLLRARLLSFLVLALLATALIFSHGCHGDEDTELLSRGWWVLF
jgi:hypothetical protein